MKKYCRSATIVFIMLFIFFTYTNAQVPFPRITVGVDKANNPQEISQTLQILFLITILALAPSILIMMTSFSRIIIVFHFLRSALGTQTVPPNQILVGLAVFLTFFIMRPVINEVNEKALQPYLHEEINQQSALQEAERPIKAFMLKQTRDKELELFVSLSGQNVPTSSQDIAFSTVIPAFIISEIKTAFQIGFLIYLPMVLIDIIVASVLLSLGMMMLPPMMISMPLKILLFVLVDGWYLVVESLIQGFM